MNILDKFIPRKKREEQEARETRTIGAVDESQRARKAAQDALIKSYRQAGVQMARPDWND